MESPNIHSGFLKKWTAGMTVEHLTMNQKIRGSNPFGRTSPHQNGAIFGYPIPAERRTFMLFLGLNTLAGTYGRRVTYRGFRL